MASDEHEETWLQPMEGETVRWFARFTKYLAMGAKRSIRAVYNAEIGNQEASKPSPKSWNDAAKNFAWQRRAAAYEEYQRRIVISKSRSQLIKLRDAMHKRLLAELDTLPINDKFLSGYLAVVDATAKQHVSGSDRGSAGNKAGTTIAVESQEGERSLRVLVYTPEVEALDFDASDTRSIDAGSVEQAAGLGVDDDEQG